ncbi:MAG: hypothetical protein F6K32_22465 [Desertifilum sp. SIO1I2]|nr:hypothetical protein [Desertifilum sp. SIO1I2]
MTQRDNFVSGFLFGSVVGGVVGGVLGALLVSRRNEEALLNEETRNALEAKTPGKTKPLKATDDDRIETARRSLEDKIAQLNETIDEVRQQLGNVNGTPQTSKERSRPTP